MRDETPGLRAARPGRRTSPLFGWVIGVVTGLMVAVLVVPETQDDAARETTEAAAEQAVEAGGAAADTGDSPSVTGAVDAGPSPDAGGTGEAGSAGPAGAAVDDANGGDAAPGPGVATTIPGVPPPTRNVRGVTDTKIRIGIAVPDLGAIAALGPGYDQGDLQEAVAAILEGWRRDKVVPIHGRDVEFVYRKFNIISAEAVRAACVGLVQDEKVFAVIAVHNFDSVGEGSMCVASEFKTPLVAGDGPYDNVYAAAPSLFTMQMSSSRVLRNFPHWAHRRGLLKGKKIGLYHDADATSQQQVARTLKAQLQKLGYSITEEVTTDDPVTGGSQNTVAVQRFRTAGVDLAILLVSAVAKTSFFQQAEAQLYDPDYIETDLGFSTTSTAASTYPPEHFDGTFAMTGLRFGEVHAGIAETAPARACAANLKRVTGRTLDRSGREAEWVATQQACDEALVVLHALRTAGRDLTPASFVAALETVRTMPMGVHGDVTFGPGKHHGVDRQRTLQWSAGCRCWRAQGSFDPLFVP